MTDKPIVLAVDPGQERVGIVARQGDDLLSWWLVERRAGQSLADWVGVVCSNVARIRVFVVPVDLTAIEATTAPNPHVGRYDADGNDRGARIIDPTPVLEATAVAWALYGWCKGDQVVMVPPQGFSKTADQRVDVLRQLFPSELVTTPKSELRDCRAAWLIGEAAVLRQRIDAATKGMVE